MLALPLQQTEQAGRQSYAGQEESFSVKRPSLRFTSHDQSASSTVTPESQQNLTNLALTSDFLNLQPESTKCLLVKVPALSCSVLVFCADDST